MKANESVSDSITAPSDTRLGASNASFEATRHELQQIAAFWMGVHVAHAFKVAVLGGPRCSDDTKLAAERLAMLSRFLSREELLAAFTRMEEQFEYQHDPVDYQGFLCPEVLHEGGEGAPDIGIDLPPAGDSAGVVSVASPNQTAADEKEQSLSPDVEYLFPLTAAAGRITIGFVDEICGAGGQLIPEYVPIRTELVQLVKYWVTKVVGIEFFWFEHRQVGSTDSRLRAFGARRIDRLATELTEVEVSTAIEQAENEFSADIPPKLWALYKSGKKPQYRRDGIVRWPPEET